MSLTLWLWCLALGIGQVAYWTRLPAVDTGWWLAFILLVLLVALVSVMPCVMPGLSRSGQPGGGNWAGGRALPVAICQLLLPTLIGTGWALHWNKHVLDMRLPTSQHGGDVSVSLVVTSLPDVRPAVSAFGRFRPIGSDRYDVKFSARVASAADPGLLGRKLLLGWYGVPKADVPRAGSHWQMQLRLKRPRGSVNPHTFDYEAWLLQRGVYATGYVRDRSLRPTQILDSSGLPAFRESLRDRIDDGGWDNGRLIRALLLGDRSGLSEQDEQLLRQTGTGHLLAISGLHVGMVAGCFLLVGALLSRILGLVFPYNPRSLAGVCAIGGALGYTLLCGAPLSAQRACLMASVALAGWMWRRRIPAGLAFAVALALVLIWQPLAVLSVGFWLSFGAVAALLVRFSGRLQLSACSVQLEGAEGDRRSTPLHMRVTLYLVAAWRSQWAVALALLMPSILFFSGASASALVLNLVAIPWVGLLILPSILLGAVCPGDAITNLCWSFADWQLGVLLNVLEWCNRYLVGWQSLPAPGVLVLVMGIGCVVLLLMPRGVPGRWAGYCLIPVVFAALLPRPPATREQLNVTVLDVGQGLSVVVDTGERGLVLDAGADTARGWSAGRDIVAPFLIGRGFRSLDALVVSHGDRDHAGGAAGLAGAVQLESLIAPGVLGERLSADISAREGSSPCVAGEEEQWGSLSLRWLWPASGNDALNVDGEENDHSCVGLLRWRDTRVLFTGDISRKVERELALRYPDFPPVDLLVAPHHGSRTSSSPALIRWARPERVVFSAGYRHHFGHPHPDVVERYRESGARLFNTADLGAVRFSWGEGQLLPNIECGRESLRFWFAHERFAVSSVCAERT
ncbi:DNA internalization-related competence protein ComEC/Rec2 [Microbulbifer aggregans]|uniref:DNA internalization-related competence protein ComEC/Rec2 n=1 Tax=Microbulbifer aggregans TaxID=1769779 RepID=UPI001CFCE1C6|nr:DNA internalization-related competence protein ComEC/Rec2 [Microbulbifer aggregans]